MYESRTNEGDRLRTVGKKKIAYNVAVKLIAVLEGVRKP